MTGQRPPIFFKMCWKYFTPLLLLVSHDISLQILTELICDSTFALPKPGCENVLYHDIYYVSTNCLLSLWQTAFISYLVDFRHLKINDWYVYPDWAYALGWIMMLSSVSMIPLWAVGQMCWTKGTFRQVRDLLFRSNYVDFWDIYNFCLMIIVQSKHSHIVCSSVWWSCATLLKTQSGQRGQLERVNQAMKW